VKYLIRTLSDTKTGLSQRVAAAKILLDLSKIHLPADYDGLSGFAGPIRTTAQNIFNDDSQDGQLRGLCMQFLDLSEGEVV